MPQFERNIDMAIIGENYLSYLLGIRQIKSDKSTLIIDDSSPENQVLTHFSFTYIERSFLKEWGAKHQIAPLEEIDKYLIPKRLLCLADKIKIVLGQAPCENILEIGRKLPALFDEKIFLTENWDADFGEEFDHSFLNLCKRVGAHAARYPQSQSYNIKALLLHCPPKITAIYDSFCKIVLEGQDHMLRSSNYLEYRNLLFLMRAHHQKVFSSDFSDCQLFYLFLSLLSPYFELDESALKKELKSYFIDLGGMYKKSEINSFDFSKNRPWRFELKSYEGIIEPTQLSFIDYISQTYHLNVQRCGALYGIFEVGYTFENKSLFYNEKTRFLITLKESLGTDFPLIKAHILEEKIFFSLYYLLEEAQKIEFLKERAEKYLKLVILKQLDYLDIDTSLPLSYKLRPSTAISINKDEGQSLNKNRPMSVKTPSIFPVSPISKGRMLEDTFYFGPAGPGQLGLLSSLINIAHHEC